jgi:membrane protease YdiL (CAAX protease family)
MLLLFAACYLPAGVLVGVLRLDPVPAVPVIIGASALAATALGAVLIGRGTFSSTELGLTGCTRSQAVLAVGVGAAIGLLAALTGGQAGDPRLQELRTLPLWHSALLFWLGASIQEELVFRGLLQSVVARVHAGGTTPSTAPLSAPVLVVAALFGAVHVPAGVAAAAAALLLGIAAGALRARTGSVLPAILAHAAANVVGSLGDHL